MKYFKVNEGYYNKITWSKEAWGGYFIGTHKIESLPLPYKRYICYCPGCKETFSRGIRLGQIKDKHKENCPVLIEYITLKLLNR